MIESKEQVLNQFREKAQAFLADPSLVNGIDLDDASVTLKRYVLSVMHDERLGSSLARLHKLIRHPDMTAIAELAAEVEDRFAE